MKKQKLNKQDEFNKTVIAEIKKFHIVSYRIDNEYTRLGETVLDNGFITLTLRLASKPKRSKK